MALRIATLNLCLGLQRKKDIVLDDLLKNKIDICCLQETELEKDFPMEALNSKSYYYEAEKSEIKSRVGIYIKTNIEYLRRLDLEESNHHLMIVDIKCRPTLRIINLYRSFNPEAGMSPRQLFSNQLNLIERNVTSNTVILGDFNIDASMQFRDDYSRKLLYQDLNLTIDRLDLFQIVNFHTWGRIINNVPKESILDHIYVTNNIKHSDCNNYRPVYGDHLLVLVDIYTKKNPCLTTLCRDWQKYSQQSLIQELSSANLNFKSTSAQQYWNELENVLINISDKLAPLKYFTNNKVRNPQTIPPHIKRLLNRRKKILTKNRLDYSDSNTQIIKCLNKDIRAHFYQKRCGFIKSKILPGNSKSLWTAVNIAKNLPSPKLPINMSLNGLSINPNDLPDSFAVFFRNKVQRIVENTKIDPGVYNGRNKIVVDDRFFMNYNDVKECMSTLKHKNCEGFDRIPLRIISESCEILVPTFAELFRKIYYQNKIPEQWKVAKIIPIHKKGCKNLISNYRPISNLCAGSKIFEKLILKQVNYLEKLNKLDFTGKPQHGFKKNKSTATAGIILQSLISRATDDNNYVLMASLDLSSAFDIVNVELLVKRLKILGLPKDLIALIKNWLSERCSYVEVNGLQSCLQDSNSGTIQGSILGPILYAIYVSPLFDLTKMTNFADDNFVLRWNRHMEALIDDMEKSLEMITKWLKDSGLMVNESKTEVCLFHRNDQPVLHLNVSGVIVLSKKSMNVLGVTFDCKLNWSEHVANTIRKSNKSLRAIKLIAKYFDKESLKTILAANFYSILYYNSEIWLTDNLSKVSKNHLLSASALALSICRKYNEEPTSYLKMHLKYLQPTPDNMVLYKSAMQLFKLFNTHEPKVEWIHLNFQIITGSRQSTFEVIRAFNYKIGNNILTNKLAVLNKKISLDWLNKSFLNFKWLCKHKFFPQPN